MKVTDFDFRLPEELIAQMAVPRGESRLLVLNRRTGAVQHARIRELPSFLAAGDLLVVNDTRVFPARLLGHRVPSGGAVECLLLSREEPASIDPPSSAIRHPSSMSHVQFWSSLMHPGQKLKPGALVRFAPRESRSDVLMAEVLERQFFGRRKIRLWVEGDATVDEVVDTIGHIPLPPYIHRPDTPDDRERYQTMFAAERGSVAAPTAGLHFDRAILDELHAAGIEHAAITLHVGYGTFKPVRVDTVEEHVVDPEPYSISETAATIINRALAERRRIVAVGTTTTRALEDAAQRGGGRVPAGGAKATLFIHPGFEFRVIDGLLTNFHLPKSSLLMLVSAFAGREHVLDAYRVAVEQRYRFYSYGDAMLVV